MAVAHFFVSRVVGVFEVNVKKYVDAGVCHFLAPQEFTHRTSRSPQRHALGFYAVLCQHSEYLVAAVCSTDAFYGTKVKVFAHLIPEVLVKTLRQVNLTDHCRQHMGVLEVEIIVRTIEVGRHYSYVVAAVLQTETLAHLETCNLSDGIGLVGVFEFRGEQRLFCHRLWCHTWIDTCATQEQQFLYSVTEALTNDVLLYLQVLVDEVGTVP